MENQYNKTRSLVEASLLSALIVIIMLLNVYVPLFSVVGTFLLPIPVTLLFIRHDYKTPVLAVIISAILIGMLYNPLSALGSAVVYGLTGITLGYCIKKNLKGSTTLFYLTISSLISMLISSAITIFLIYKLDVNRFIKQNIEVLKQSADMTERLYERIGVNAAQVESIQSLWEVLTPEYMMRLLPALLLMSAFISAVMNFLVTRAILKKMRYKINELVPFERVYLDNRIGALIIIIVCLGIILSTKKIVLGDYIFASSAIVLQFAFIIDGIAVALYYLRNKFNMSKPFLIFIIGFSLLSQIGMVFIYLGIADMIFDFRKVDPNRIFRRRDD